MQCPACAEKGIKTVLGHVDHMGGCTWGAPTLDQLIHWETGIEWALKHCDSTKCIRGCDHAHKHNWHSNGFCLDCVYNPYNHMAEGGGEGESL